MRQRVTHKLRACSEHLLRFVEELAEVGEVHHRIQGYRNLCAIFASQRCTFDLCGPATTMSDSEGDAGAAPSKYVVGTLSPIATPLAGKKLHSKIFKAVKKGAQTLLGRFQSGPLFSGSPACEGHLHGFLPTSAAAGAKCLRRGVKEVVKGLRKGEKGCGGTLLMFCLQGFGAIPATTLPFRAVQIVHHCWRYFTNRRHQSFARVL